MLTFLINLHQPTAYSESLKSSPKWYFTTLRSALSTFSILCAWMDAHPGVIVRRRSYNQCEFRENLIRQLAGIGLHENPPPAKRRRKQQEGGIYTKHTPLFTENRANCTVCWKHRHQRIKSSFVCAACHNQQGHLVHLCIKADKQCFQMYHSHDFDQYRWSLWELAFCPLCAEIPSFFLWEIWSTFLSLIAVMLHFFESLVLQLFRNIWVPLQDVSGFWTVPHFAPPGRFTYKLNGSHK